MTQEHEARIARLEEAFFFQERLVNDLNTALTGQQQQLEALERRIDMLTAVLEAIRETLDAGENPANTPPPHYL